MSPSPMQILIVVVIILVLFGASRLGEVGKGLGEGIKNFKKGLSGDGDDEDDKEAKQLESQDKKVDLDVEEKKEKA